MTFRRSVTALDARVLGFVALLLGCEHGEPFSAGHYAPGGPFSGAIPRRLTFSTGADLYPSWKPDESGLLYSYQVTDGPVADRCLGELPPDGGSRSASLCPDAPLYTDSLNALEEPATSNSRVAYLSSVGPPSSSAPDHRELLVSPLNNPSRVDTILRFPFVSSSGEQHDTPTHIGWLRSNALVYVGARVDYVPPCLSCGTRDTLFTGLEIARVDLSGPVPIVSVIPGTTLASSVQASEDQKAIYYTISGESVVYRQVLASGAVSVVHDFGGLGIARDVQVSGNVLVAVVGGSITFANDSVYGLIARDIGGRLLSVDLQTGQESDITIPGQVHRRPALSRSGLRLAVESYPAPGLGAGDLWLVQAP